MVQYGTMKQSLYTLLPALIFSLLAASCAQQATKVESPGNINTIEFILEDGVPYYTVHHSGMPVITASRLGFELQDLPGLDGVLRSHRPRRVHFR
jgi:hypothetical protein